MALASIPQRELQKAIDTFNSEAFSTLELISVIREMFPVTWQQLETSYGVGGKGAGKQYTSFSRVGQQLVELVKKGVVKRSTYKDSPEVYGSHIIRHWLSNTKESKEWSDAEYKAAVEAYLWMLDQEHHSNTYNKSKVNQDLRDGPLAARSKPSVEFRMRNISAVLKELCLPWIKGYLPASNVRGEGKEKIKFYLANAGAYTPEDYVSTDDPDILDKRVRHLKKKIAPSSDPVGNKTPQQTSGTVTRYIRDVAVKASVLTKAGGSCEGCGLPAPFIDGYGEPFLEVHHLKQLRDKGSDTVTNAVALCPNCHRRCHHSIDQTTFIDSIYLKISRLIRE